jgi:hypothetical protein
LRDLILSSSARTLKTAFGSELLAPFQFLRIARRALLSLYSASDQSQAMEANKIGLIILRTPYLQLIKSLQENSGTCLGIALNNASRGPSIAPWSAAWQCWREPAGFGVYF